MERDTSCVFDIDPRSCHLTPQIFLSNKHVDCKRFALWRPGDGGRESENCSLSMASSSASKLQAAASRRKEASGAARRGRNSWFSVKKLSLVRRDLSVKFLKYLQFEMPKNSISCMGQAHTSDALTVLIFTLDEARAQWLASTKVHFHSPLGEM